MTNAVTLASVAGNGFYARNRIINGAMEIDQRNAGASVTPTSDGIYTLDRWQVSLSQASKFSLQRSTTAPTGFINSTIITSLSAYSVGASDYFMFNQPIEGLNMADFGWGSASAQTVTLSFWVQSSLTGTFGGAIQNASQARSYPFSYTISAANTWEKKSVTIPGDTTGTWLTSNLVGLYLRFSFGVGSTFSAAANTWAAGQYFAPTGATSVVGTNGATFYLTGVQLEVGTVATPFERRLYSQELAMCQRYYETSDSINTSLFWSGGVATANTYFMPVKFVVTKRGNPTITITNVSNSGFTASIAIGDQSTVGFRAQAESNTTNAGSNYFRSNWQAAAEL